MFGKKLSLDFFSLNVFSESLLQKYFILSVVGFALLLVVFMGCNAMIRRKCKSLPIIASPNTNNQNIPMNENLSEEQDTRSDYASINEVEMLSATPKNDEPDHVTPSTSPSSAKSGPSYLEIIDEPEVVNRYQSTFSTYDSSDLHVYRTTFYQPDRKTTEVVYENEKI